MKGQARLPAVGDERENRDSKREIRLDGVNVFGIRERILMFQNGVSRSKNRACAGRDEPCIGMRFGSNYPTSDARLSNGKEADAASTLWKTER